MVSINRSFHLKYIHLVWEGEPFPYHVIELADCLSTLYLIFRTKAIQAVMSILRFPPRKPVGLLPSLSLWKRGSISPCGTDTKQEYLTIHECAACLPNNWSLVKSGSWKCKGNHNPTSAMQIWDEILAIGIQAPHETWLVALVVSFNGSGKFTLVLWILRRKRKAQRVFTHPGGAWHQSFHHLGWAVQKCFWENFWRLIIHDYHHCFFAPCLRQRYSNKLVNFTDRHRMSRWKDRINLSMRIEGRNNTRRNSASTSNESWRSYIHNRGWWCW